jgi:hypothetical protein
MALSRLQDDLLHDFKEQKKMIELQLDVFNPLGIELSKPAAVRLVHKGLFIFAEIVCYLLCVSAIALVVFLPKTFPFYILQELRENADYRKLGWLNIEVLNISVYVMLGIIAILFFCVSRAMRSIRLKNDILHFAGKHIKTMVGQHLQRKAAIETVTQRHFLELPPLPGDIVSVPTVGVNDVPNPGFSPMA